MSANDRLWVETDGFGRCRLEGNAHTFPGRMAAWSETLASSVTISRSDVRDASPEAWAWIDGFLSGNEPEFHEFLGIDAFAAELVDRFGPLPEEARHLLDTVVLKSLCRRANVAKIEAGPKGAVLSFRDDTFANPEGLVAFIREQGSDARVRPDMKVVFFDDWEEPQDRLKGATAILRRLVTIAERAKAA